MAINILIATVILTPLAGAIIAGFLPQIFARSGVSFFTTTLTLLSFILSCVLAYFVFSNGESYNVDFYTWIGISKHLNINVGFMVDRISVFMILIVTFVSTLVHLYSIGYMQEEDGYCRFFAYISGFTFTMLCLVMGNNFLILFFGWEGVGVFSYLLIGFYFDRDKANHASLKAFIMNRVGDLGFLLGIGIVLYYCRSLDYQTVFGSLSNIDNTQTLHLFGMSFSPITMMCTLLFIGAMGKSAQFPLHTWLEGSMEGPTPISALIHAATMVTAGVFMIARLSPMFVLSESALSFVMIIGAITCLFMGLLAIVQNDIKRVIAYCTLSQLGYMMVAMGASAFSIGMFHLLTHAMFKALLFLAAGSVIVAMHHEQDIRKMGNLRKYMPITYIAMFIGAWSLAALPPFSGFFSKDLIIDATKNTTITGHEVAYFSVIAGAFVTSFYIFRMFFTVFHGKERMDEHTRKELKEASWTITLPLIVLLIPSIALGWLLFKSILSQGNGLFGNLISQFSQTSLGDTNIVSYLSHEGATSSPLTFVLHSFSTLSFWLAFSAFIIAYIIYVRLPKFKMNKNKLTDICGFIYFIIVKKYFFDILYDVIFVRIFLTISHILWYVIDVYIVDKICVQGISKTIYNTGNSLTKTQRGYLFDYALVMMLGVLVFTLLLVVI